MCLSSHPSRNLLIKSLFSRPSIVLTMCLHPAVDESIGLEYACMLTYILAFTASKNSESILQNIILSDSSKTVFCFILMMKILKKNLFSNIAFVFQNNRHYVSYCFVPLTGEKNLLSKLAIDNRWHSPGIFVIFHKKRFPGGLRTVHCSKKN